jgi:hypothetical protein
MAMSARHPTGPAVHRGSLAAETGDGFPVELLQATGRDWRYAGGGYSVASNTASVTITVGNTAPTAVIDTPAPTLT